MKHHLLGIGMILTLAALACSLGVPAAPTLVPVEPTPRSPEIVKSTTTSLPAASTPDSVASPLGDTSNLTPDSPTPVLWSLEPLTTLQNNRLGQIYLVSWRPDGKALLVHLGKNLHLF